ncbi:TonB-dependent receptor [Panacagrimonas sp.]|uniref:TonB-dependent receptor n=1 Tax=Panacagrimonas sp. TaxID=2480088 RepID=UPI003B525B94
MNKTWVKGMALLLCAGVAMAAEEVPTVPTIEVYASSPLGPPGGDAQRAIANTQSLDGDALAAPGQRAVGDALQDLGSVFRTDATGSPFQPDLFYRGYSISPLLGLPQGLAVYLDGVRVNEPFGDTVNFDLIPLIALQRADLIPGSNPVFGRNTLAGALALSTKTGFDAPGVGLHLSAGEFGRRGASAEYGVAAESAALYLAAEHFEEDGWRDFSDSRASRLFMRGTWLADDHTQLDASLQAADNRVRGNGATPLALLEAEGREAVFTHPDQTRPELMFLTLAANRQLDGNARLSATGYVRSNRIDTFNGDGTEFEACERPANVDGAGNPFLCEEESDEEEVVEDLNGEPVLASDDNTSATQNRSRTDQTAYGLALQFEKPLGNHRVVTGASADFGDIEFDSGTELARLTDVRGTVGSGIFVGEAVVDVDASNDSVGVYLMDTWRVSEQLELTAAGRWNRTEIELRDQIPDGDLSGQHDFSRFNPMVGASYALTPQWTAFGSWSQSTRAPTPVELTCANPEDPCRLPNGFVDDPPLDEVVTRTAELGLRHRSQRWSGSVALFHAVSRDDILFITDGNLTNTGYFDNVGETLREGVELLVDVDLGHGWHVEAAYTALVAEFSEDFLVNSPNHPVRDPLDEDQPADFTRQVEKGDAIPLIPRQQGRLALDWHDNRWHFDLEAVGRGHSRYRGDEANVDPEKIPGFVVLGAHADWKVTKNLELHAGVENLLDRDFETFGVYGEGDEVLGDEFEEARRFVGAGAPTTFEAGVSLVF